MKKYKRTSPNPSFVRRGENTIPPHEGRRPHTVPLRKGDYRGFYISALIIGVLAIFALMWLEQALSFVLGPYWMRILMLSGIAIILAVSLNLVNGFAGQFSLGHAGFYAIGAYISAIVTKTWGNQIINSLTTGLHLAPSLATGILMLIAIIVGLVSASIAGLLVGLPSLRLRGDYLAIATLGFGEAIRVIIQNSETLGAQRGLRGIGSYTTFVWIFVFVILVIIFARNLAISSHGRALFAIRDDEIAAESAGVAVFKYKVMAFAMSAGWAGIAGALFAHYDAYLSPQTFGFMKSVDIVVMVVLGGGGSITGSVIAAVALTALPEVLREYLPRDFQNFRMVVYALMLVLLMLTRPQGIFGRTELSIVGIWRALRGKIRKTHPVEEAGR